MDCNPTLSAEEFKIIHNALCTLDGQISELDGVVHPKIYQKIEKSLKDIRRGLADAYSQDQEAGDRKSQYYDRMRASFGLKSIWSLYEVPDLLAAHPYKDAKRLVYRDHWGEKPVAVDLNSDCRTWLDLYTFADTCINQSGDNHHVFVEDFVVDSDDQSCLVLHTGS